MTARMFILLALAALIACSPAAPPADIDSTNPNGQTIILWHSAEGSIRRALLAQVDEFNATNPWGILVVAEYHGSAAQTIDHLKSAIDAGRAPELVLGVPLDTLRLGQAVVPIEPYVVSARYGLADADLADLYPADLDANRDPHRGGALVSFPLGGEGTVLVYNVDRLASQGYLTPPDSWALFKEVCLVTTVDRNGDRKPEVFGLAFAPRPDFVAAWFLSRGAPVLSPDGSQIGFGGEPGLKLLETLADVSKGGCLFPTPGVDADVDAFSTGRVAMIFASTSSLNKIARAIEDRGGFRWAVAPVPHGQAPVTLGVSGPSWILLSSTPEKQLAAWLFMRWFANIEQTQAWALNTGQLPLRRSAADKLKQQSAENPNYKTILDLLSYGKAQPLVAYWPDAAEAVTRAVLAVTSGASPAAVQTQAATIVSELIAK